ncbi:MAG: carbohydrate ABC transporter permease [Candidatus Limivicinus sp.]
MKKNQFSVAMVFLLPFLLLFFIFRLFPSVAGVAVSFTSWNIIGKPSFAGLANFKALFHDQYFYIALLNTLKFMLYCLPPLVILGLLFALMLNSEIKGRNLARTFIFMPYVLTPAVIGVIWYFLYNTNSGIINYYLSCIGIGKVPWLTSEKWALFSVSVTSVWWLVGYNMLLFLTGLQNIPKELTEAAMMDGAGKIQTFFHITLPQLKTTLSLVITMSLINVIQVFDQIYTMTGGGPGTATLTLVQYLYNTAFQNFNMGYAGVIGNAILLLLSLLVLLQNVLIKKETD